MKAKGLVAEIRRVIGVKDSFTRIRQERDQEAQVRRDELLAKQRKAEEERATRSAAMRQFAAAFGESNPHVRGTKVEVALNQLFSAYGLSVRESFRISDEKSGTTLEQIDGVIELDGHLYFVEAKWLSARVDINDVSRHLIRVYHRGQTRGLFISATEFSEPALAVCREALQKTVVALATFEELIKALEDDGDLAAILRAKIVAAQTEKNPFHRIR